MPGAGRSEQDVRAGKTPDPLKTHERPQRKPVVRHHPVTGKRVHSFSAKPARWTGSKDPWLATNPAPMGRARNLLYRLMHHFHRA